MADDAPAQTPSQLRDQARHHKRQSARHRREARRLMEQAAVLEDELARRGIRLETRP